MKTLKQLENLTPLTSEMQATIIGGKHGGWLRRILGRHNEIEHPNGDDHGNHNNGDRNRRRRGGRG